MYVDSHTKRVKSAGGIAAVPLGASKWRDAAMQLDPRPARPDDLYAIEDIVRRAYSLYVSRIGRAPGPTLRHYGALIDDGRVHVVERDGAILGILELIPEKEAMLLDSVAGRYSIRPGIRAGSQNARIRRAIRQGGRLSLHQALHQRGHGGEH